MLEDLFEMQEDEEGRDEMNLAEFPIARLGRRDARTTIAHTSWHTSVATGERYQQRWEVSANAKYGLPTEFGERVLVALLKMAYDQNFTRVTRFTAYRIIKALHLQDHSSNYKYVYTALDQLAGLTIISQQAFWDNDEKKRITTKHAFHLIDEYQLRVEGDDNNDTSGYLVWGEHFWKSFNAGYIKQLDLSFFYDLSPLARRLYRFLDKRMYNTRVYEIDIFELASRMGLARYDYPSQVATKFQPAFDELIER